MSPTPPFPLLPSPHTLFTHYTSFIHRAHVHLAALSDQTLALDLEFNTTYEEMEDEKRRLKEFTDEYGSVVDEYLRCVGCTIDEDGFVEKLGVGGLVRGLEAVLEKAM